MHRTTARAASPSRRLARASVAAVLVVALAAPATASVAAPGPDQPTSSPQAAIDPTTFVNPFVATQHDYGQDMPGAFVPSGLVKASPVTAPTRSHSGYDYAQSQITGFVHTNVDGAGGNGEGGDFLVVPTAVTYTHRPTAASYAKPFTHGDEAAAPGYYRVGLGATQGTDSATAAATGTIDAEVTATVRTGVDRYTFPASSTGRVSLVVDLNNNFDRRVTSSLEVATLPDGRTSLSGEVVGVHGGTYRLYYYAETSLPTAQVQTWDGTGALTDATRQRGWDNGAVLSFAAPAAGTQVSLAVTFSGISVGQAQRDQRAELSAIDAAGGSASRPVDATTFDAVRAAAHQTWQDTLGKVAVTATTLSDPTGDLRTLFYTGLYRMLASPVDVTSTDGTYRGGDGVVYPADGRTHYDSWSTWDDFRKVAVVSLLYPDLYRDSVQSMVDMFAEVARAGVSNPGQLVHSVPGVRWERTPVVVADALAKGFALDRLAEAYPALARYSGSAYSSTGIPTGSDAGYLPKAAGVDDTVGTSYDDWAMAQIAESIGKTSDATAYRVRATNYRNLIRPAAWTAGDGTQVGVLTPRDSSGWLASDLEKFQLNDPYQGSLWQYGWYPAHDMAGLMAAMGGKAAASAALSHFFGEEAPTDCTRMLHSNANEVDIQTPYLFNYVGEPAKTQKWVRQIYTASTCNRYVATTENLPGIANNGEFLTPRAMPVFQNSPVGLLPTMDDDLGTMSTMFVTAALGLFPVTEGTDQLQIGTPFFDRVDITHDDGTTFSIQADGVSSSSYYIKDATLRSGSGPDASLTNTWVSYGALAGTGSLRFTMSPTATSWGAGSTGAYSMSDPTTPAVSTTPSRGPAPTGAGTAATWRARLTTDLAQAAPVVQGGYTASSYRTLDDARGLATAALADPTTSRERLVTIDARLTGAVDALTLDEGGLRRLEAESSNKTSGGTLKAEANASSGDLGGVADGSWITYIGMTWGDATPTGVQVRYANMAGSGSNDAKVEIHAGDASGPLVGTVDLPPTGAAWSDYRVSSATLSGSGTVALTAASSVTFVFRGSGTWVANVDWLQLTTTPVTARVPLSAGSTTADGSLSGGSSDLNLTSDPNKIQNIKDGAWVAYAASSAAARGAVGADRVSVRYDKPTSRAPQDSSLEIRTGSATGPLVATVPLSYTGSAWGTYAATEVAVDDPSLLASPQDLYVVFRSTGQTAALPYVANVLSLRFSSSPSTTTLRAAQQAAQTALADPAHQLPASIATLRRALTAADDALADTALTHGSLQQVDVDTAALRLRLATAQAGLVEWTPPVTPPVVTPPVVTPPVVTPPVVTPPVAVRATLTATVAATRYRARATVHVRVAVPGTSARPAGTVVVTQGGRRLATAKVSGATAAVRLPATLTVGTHALTVTFTPAAGSGVTGLATAKARLRVTKGLTTVRVTKVAGLREGHRATVTVQVKKLGAHRPKGGAVRVVVHGRTVGKAKVRKKGGRWVAVVRTKTLTRTGKVTVVFSGTTKLAKRTVVTKRAVVTKRTVITTRTVRR